MPDRPTFPPPTPAGPPLRPPPTSATPDLPPAEPLPPSMWKQPIDGRELLKLVGGLIAVALVWAWLSADSGSVEPGPAAGPAAPAATTPTDDSAALDAASKRITDTLVTERTLGLYTSASSRISDSFSEVGAVSTYGTDAQIMVALADLERETDLARSEVFSAATLPVPSGPQLDQAMRDFTSWAAETAYALNTAAKQGDFAELERIGARLEEESTGHMARVTPLMDAAASELGLR